MAGITTTQLAAILGAYFRNNSHVVRDFVYQTTELSPYMTTVGRVKGKFPAMHSIAENIIQGFTTTWNELGGVQFKVNELVNRHVKGNVPLYPDNIENTWLAELNDRRQKPTDRAITQTVIDAIMKKYQENLNYLQQRGVYDANDLGTFGKAFDGVKTIVAAGVASSDNPMYKIPVDVLTSANAVDVIEDFEDKFPEKLRDLDMPIFLGKKELKDYMKDYRSLYGKNNDYEKSQTVRSYLTDRQLVGLSQLSGTGLIFSTPKDNFLRLVDFDTPPAITDIQVQDYKVKLFMESWDGVGFWTNQMVVTNVSQGSGSGLNTDNTLYFA